MRTKPRVEPKRPGAALGSAAEHEVVVLVAVLVLAVPVVLFVLPLLRP
jgi:hypothetical protein